MGKALGTDHLAAAPAGLDIDLLDAGGGALPPQSSQRFVERDAGQPGGQLRIAAKTLQMGEGLDVAGLHHVFGFRVIAHNRPGDAEQALVVALDNHADRGLIAHACEIDQRIIVAGFQIGSVLVCA